MKRIKHYKRVGLLMFALALALASHGAQAQPAPGFNLLIVDETHTITESFQVATFAARLTKAGFSVKGIAEIPLGANPGERAYDLIVVVPEAVAQVWLVTGDLPERLPAQAQEAFWQIKGIAVWVFEGGQAGKLRDVVDAGEDMAPSLYGSLFLHNGWLIPAERGP